MDTKKTHRPKEKLTPREISKQISTGETKPQFIGKKSSRVLQAELFALINKKEAFRDSNWKTKYNAVKQLSKKYGIWDGLVTKYNLAVKGYDM